MEHMFRNIYEKTLPLREQEFCAWLQVAQSILVHAVSIVNEIRQQHGIKNQNDGPSLSSYL